jgi:hypothetical protein
MKPPLRDLIIHQFAVFALKKESHKELLTDLLLFCASCVSSLKVLPKKKSSNYNNIFHSRKSKYAVSYHPLIFTQNQK